MAAPAPHPTAPTPDTPAVPSAEYIREYLRLIYGIQISAEEADALVPLVGTQRRLFKTLERFDVSAVRPALSFDPSAPYGPAAQ